jgi:tetratricopeptide (TPR) repeat protein
MFASIINKVSLTLLMLAVLSTIVSCESKLKSQEANSSKGQSESINGAVKQVAPNDLQIKEEILGLRQLLYADGSLKELASLRFDSNEIIDEQGRRQRLSSTAFEINKVFDKASLLIENGKPQQALDFLQSVNIKHDLKRDPAYWLVSAYARQQLGNLQASRQSLHEALKFPEIESRGMLNVWKVLRELGDKPEPANQVLGVIAEIGYDETVAIVAGYADGESRLFIGSGGGVLGPKESFPEDTRIAAKELVAAAQPFVKNLPLENARDLPRQGQVKFVLLTNSGIYVIKDEIAHLNKEDSQFYPLWIAVNTLLTPSLKFLLEGEKK